MKKNGSDKNLLQKILDLSDKEIPRINFFDNLLDLILDFTATDFISILLIDENKYNAIEKGTGTRHTLSFKTYPVLNTDNRLRIPDKTVKDVYDIVSDMVLANKFTADDGHYTENGSLIIKNIDSLPFELDTGFTKKHLLMTKKNNNYKSLAVIPLILGEKTVGLIRLQCTAENHFSSEQVEMFERIIPFLAIVLEYYYSKAELRQTSRRIALLNQLLHISSKPDLVPDNIFEMIIRLLPKAFQFPEITEARIQIDDKIYTTSYYPNVFSHLASDINVNSQKRGMVEVIYREIKPELFEGPFSEEERQLIDLIGLEIGRIIERKEALIETNRLHEQLRQSDRLTILGQMAANVTHELNESIGSIMGFAQLAAGSQKIPRQVRSDLEKIVKASLYSREIIKRLISFTREIPQKSSRVNLNNVINDSLLFFESRCSKEGIELIKSLEENLPDVRGDFYQFTQMLINLVVNSIKAMPFGGKLIIKTSVNKSWVSLNVEDTGNGMTEDTKNKIFQPFFTTRDITEGTGLGLSIVQGIVNSNGGKIDVESSPGKGSRFEILFPAIK